MFIEISYSLFLLLYLYQIVVPGTSKLKDVLEELHDLLTDTLDSYTFEEGQNIISLNAPSVDFVGKEIKVVRKKTSELITKSQDSKIFIFLITVLHRLVKQSLFQNGSKKPAHPHTFQILYQNSRASLFCLPRFSFFFENTDAR